MEIDTKIEKLDPEKRQIFYQNLRECLHDRVWCTIHKIDYNNLPREDFNRAREQVYKDLFTRKSH